MKILIIATSHAQMGDTNRKTGIWLEGLAAPYYVFREAGTDTILASPKGIPIPLDPKSESIIASTAIVRRFQKDPEAISWMSRTAPLNTQKAEDFDAVFLTGGHGAMWDFPGNETLQQLLEDFNRQQKLIVAVSHGTAGLLSLRNHLGELLVKARQLTAFSNSEEHISGLTGAVPFLLESKLISLGALYTKRIDFVSHVVTDGNIITGQNPASAREAAKQLLISLKESPLKAVTSLY